MFFDIIKSDYMKSIACYLKYFTWMLCLLFTVAACSDDDNTTEKVAFPELQKINGEVGQILDLEFDATMDWKLTSSSLWCQFVDGDETVNSCSGTSGKQTVKVKIMDAASELGKSYKAEISLWMSGQNAVIYEVTRPTIGYELVITDDKGNTYTQNDIVTFPYTKGTFKIKANFTWQCSQYPEWVSMNKASAIAGEEGTINATIAAGNTINPASGELIFINEDHKEVIKLKVKFDGIPDDKIEYSINKESYWTFSLDGTKYSTASVSGTTTWIDGPMSFTATAKNNSYKVIPLWVNGAKYARPSQSNWFSIADNNAGLIKVAGTENKTEDSRVGCVMVFPIAVYNAIGEANFDQTVIPGGALATAYKDYLALSFNQSGVPYGFKIYDADKNRISAVSLLGEKTSEELIQQYGVDNVYRAKLTKAYAELTVYPNGLNYCQPQKQAATGWEGMSVKPNYGDNFTILNTPSSAQTEVVIKINDSTGELHGVLILSAGN